MLRQKKKHSPNALKQAKKCNVIFHLCEGAGGGVSDSHVQAQILPGGAHKGDYQVGRTLFLTNVKLQGLEDRWFSGLTLPHKSEK